MTHEYIDKAEKLAEAIKPDGLELEPLFTVAQVARYLQVSGTTVYRLVKDGTLPCRRIGQSLRFTRGDVERLLELCALDAER